MSHSASDDRLATITVWQHHRKPTCISSQVSGIIHTSLSRPQHSKPDTTGHISVNVHPIPHFRTQPLTRADWTKPDRTGHIFGITGRRAHPNPTSVDISLAIPSQLDI